MLNILKYVPRILFALLRNFGVAIAISIFFAAAHRPVQVGTPNKADAPVYAEMEHRELTPAAGLSNTKLRDKERHR